MPSSSYVPSDALNPNWEDYDKVHGWRNYATDELQAMWPTFTDDQKRCIAASLQYAADQEKWD